MNGPPLDIRRRGMSSRASTTHWGRLLCTGTAEQTPYRRIELTSTEFVIGRDPKSNEVYNNPQLSSTHCKIVLKRPSEESRAAADEERVPYGLLRHPEHPGAVDG